MSEGLFKGAMVSFATFRGPLRRRAVVLPGASCKRSTYASLVFSSSLAGCAVQWFTDNATLSPLFALVV